MIWQVDKDDSHLEEGQSSVIICSVHTEDKSGSMVLGIAGLSKRREVQ